MKKGEEYKSNNYGGVTVVAIVTPSTSRVEFENTGGRHVYRNSDIRAGKMKDYSSASMYGVGKIMNLKLARDNPESFSTWSNMIKRGYDKVWKESNPTYKEVTVRANWHQFPAFHQWYSKQAVGDGYILDKDIMSKRKSYSASSAFMVPHELNMIYSVNTKQKEDTPLGVHKVGNKFAVRINGFNTIFPSDQSSKGSYVGTYSNTRTASRVYKYYRARLILSMIKKYKGKINNRLYSYVVSSNKRIVKKSIPAVHMVNKDPIKKLMEM